MNRDNTVSCFPGSGSQYFAARLRCCSASACFAAAPIAASQALQWRMVGPFRGGRTRAVTGVPGQPDTFLIGAVNGGVWKTTDGGRTWNPLFDAAPTQSIGAIAVAPSDPKIIYVASGEGLMRPDLSVGNGIYRSEDSGLHWTHLALDDAQQIPDLAVDPKDPNRLYAAVLGHPFGPSSQRGIFRSTDGGKNWTRVLYVNDDTGGSCIKIDPADPKRAVRRAVERSRRPVGGQQHIQRHRGRTVQVIRRRRALAQAVARAAGESVADRSGGCPQQAGTAVRNGRHDLRGRLWIGCRTRHLSIR